MTTSKTRVTAYIPEEVKQKADKIAKKEGRSLSNWIERLILSKVDERG